MDFDSHEHLDRRRRCSPLPSSLSVLQHRNLLEGAKKAKPKERNTSFRLRRARACLETVLGTSHTALAKKANDRRRHGKGLLRNPRRF